MGKLFWCEIFLLYLLTYCTQIKQKLSCSCFCVCDRRSAGTYIILVTFTLLTALFICACLSVCLLGLCMGYQILCSHCRESYRGDLSAEEMAALEQAAQIKAQALAKISSREQEIIAIAEGILLPAKKVR